MPPGVVAIETGKILIPLVAASVAALNAAT